MPQPSTRRSSLDSFLPQFAPPIDEPTQPGTIPNSDKEHVGVNDRLKGANGHTSVADGNPRSADPPEDSFVHHPNGTVGNPMLETILDPALASLNGIGTIHAHPLGAAIVAPAISAAEAEIELAEESDDSTAAGQHLGDEINGNVGAHIGESWIPAAPNLETGADQVLRVEPDDLTPASDDTVVEQASEIEPVDGPSVSIPEEGSRSLRPGELPPHPAAGSLFCPYLVTEIRQLRNRRSRRSWWRRIFG